MKHGLGVAGLLCAMFAAGSAWGQDYGSYDDAETVDATRALNGRPWYVSGMFSYVDADSDRGTKGGLGTIVSIGKKVTWGLTLELSGYYASADDKHGNGSADLYGYGASALFFPSRTLPNAYGIVSVMQGRTEHLPGVRAHFDSTVFDVGFGYLQPITPHILVRAEARYRTDDKGAKPTGPKGKTNNFAEGVYSVGLMFPFGGVAAQPVEQAEEAPVTVVDTESADDDNDGVSNDLDQCPDSPAGSVDENGCPTNDSGAADTETSDDSAAGGNGDAGTDDTNGADSADAQGAAGNTDCRTPQAGEQVDENGCAVDAATP